MAQAKGAGSMSHPQSTVYCSISDEGSKEERGGEIMVNPYVTALFELHCVLELSGVLVMSLREYIVCCSEQTTKGTKEREVLLQRQREL